MRVHLFLIIIIALVLRTLWLDKIPTGITGDELDYVMNAKAVFFTGKDITGSWSPFSLTTPPNEIPKAELPYLVMAPFIGSTNFSLFTARLPYAFISIAFVIIIYLISYKLFSEKVAFISGLAMAINPWSVYFGRTAYDTPLAVFFYFLAFYVLLIAKKWYILLAFPFLFLAFFSYIGTKVIFLPFTAIIIFFAWKIINKKGFTKQYIILFLLSLTTVLFFLLLLQNQRVHLRTQDLASPYNPKISNLVNTERQLSIQTPLTNIISNRFVVFVKDSINTYTGAFSPGLLFLYGENTPFISLWYHGLFYYLDFVFLILGLSFLFKNNKTLWVFFASLIFISPLPAVASTVGLSYSIRSSLLFPILVLIISFGIWRVINIKKNKLYKVSISGFLILSYSILLANFLYLYFFRHPIFNSDSSGLSGRIISKYIQLAKTHNEKVTVIESSNLGGSSTFKQYLFYTNGYNKFSAKSIKELIRSNSLNYDNLKIASCPNKQFPEGSIIISESSIRCPMLPKDSKELIIPRLSDGGAIYTIFNDSLCSKYKLKPYPQNITLSDFEIDKLSEKKFCETFITDLSKINRS